MKNLIGYYYNLFIKEFKRSGDAFFFHVGKEKYEFIPCTFDHSEVYRNYLIAKSVGLYCHEIVINKDGLIVTGYNDMPYILIKKHICIDSIITLKEIINYDVRLGGTYEFDLKRLWQEKVDHYENEFPQLVNKMTNFKSCFNYYIGLSETAISLLNYVDISNIESNVCHRRIWHNETLCEFFNPVWIVIDNWTRDIAEFIKSSFLCNQFNVDNVYSLLEHLQFNQSECILFLARLLYPTYFFDLYDEFVLGRCNEKKLDFLLSRVDDYEMLIKKVYLYFRNKHTFPDVEWLNN